MQMFSNDLKEQANKTINYEMKKIIPLTNKEEEESFENQEIFHICEKELCINKNNKKEFKLKQKVRDHFH